MTSSRACVLATLLLLGAGCSRGAPTSPTPSAPRGPGMNVIVAVHVHGVLGVPSPFSPGVQGRLTPWLVGDDGKTYDLELGPGLEALSDPASSGRGVTISGDISLQFPAPVGAEPNVLRVTTFSFD